MISIPIIKTLFNDGLNSSGSASRYRRAIGGPPIAAIIPKIPENVPATKELVLFLLITHPKKEASPAKKTITPTEIERYFSFNINKNNKPIGPPTNLPATKGLTELKSTLFLSLINTRIANGKPNRDKSWGTNRASICTTIGDAITANPNPSIPWTDDPIKINRAIKINSKRVRSKGRLNQALLLWA